MSSCWKDRADPVSQAALSAPDPQVPGKQQGDLGVGSVWVPGSGCPCREVSGAGKRASREHSQEEHQRLTLATARS